MKKVIFIISILLFLNCNSDEELNPNEIINDINISKITVIGSSGFKEIFELNSKNQIVKKILDNTINDIITYNFVYDNSGKLVKQTRTPIEVQGNEYFSNTEYDSSGLLTKHKSGTGLGYSVSVDNSDINNPIIQRRGMESKWEFNNYNEPLNDEWNYYTYNGNNLISEKSEGDTWKTVRTIEYNSIKNPIAITKQNTYGKRNLLFHFFDPIYPFEDKILNTSLNLFSNSSGKYTVYESDGITVHSESISTLKVEILQQENNYATHFIIETKNNYYSTGNDFTTEYIIELK